MRRLFQWHVALALAGLLAVVPGAPAQQGPHIGYIYPAGGRQGTEVEVSVGGRYLNGVTSAQVSGQGVRARIIEHIKIGRAHV